MIQITAQSVASGGKWTRSIGKNADLKGSESPMACQIRNIADFSGNSHHARMARRGKARVYQFPARPACSPAPAEEAQPSPESPQDSTTNRGLFLGLEVGAGLFIYVMWFLWHLHR